jgi:hypothetical protein
MSREQEGLLANLSAAVVNRRRPNPIKDYMRRHGCGYPEALEALAAQLGPPTARDIRRALQTLGRAGAPVDLLEALEAWSDGQMQQAA